MGETWETPPAGWALQNIHAFAVAVDGGLFPDHFVVTPRAPVSSWIDAGVELRDGVWELVAKTRDLVVEATGAPAQISFNEGPDVDRVEIHVAPGGSAVRATIEAVPRVGRDANGASLVDARDGRFLKLELLRCLSNEEFNRVDLLVSFIMKSGLNLIARHLEAAIERGANVRVLTTDYMHVTDADALAKLLDLAESAQTLAGSISIRVFSDRMTSFHPKAYLFHGSHTAAAAGFVGSNNLSNSGIDGGVEWSLSTSDVRPLVEAFDDLWSDRRSIDLTHQFLRTYRTAWRPTAGHEVAVGVATEPAAEAPQPREVQLEALAALSATRDAGFTSGLVVMATGLGKTWLAAFDSVGFGRTLFVAHREEILRQSRDVFRSVRPDAELGLYTGAEKQPNADVVFASVQTLARNLERFDPDEFEYVVIDEFHHAAASSYRRVLDHFKPKFLLGITATPERMDGADLFALCGDNLVFDCGLVEGIDRGDLVPFRYWGIKDVADYEAIPWRNGRFDPEVLASRIETQQRAQQALDEWEFRCGERTLGFCASVNHAQFMADYFSAAGVRCVAVHSQPGSADRQEALEQLRSGALQVVFAVDMFNEGVDVPEIDSVLMLRPTESPVIFLQQLGRGLRLSTGKDHLRVVDFVGNHRSFLLHPRALLGMSGGAAPTADRILEALESGDWDLPAGCMVTFDVEAIDVLRLLAERRPTGADALEQFCTTYNDEHETRPSAGQASASGNSPTGARKKFGGWFGLLQHLEQLDEGERRSWGRYQDVFVALEKESVTKSYKLVTLKALLASAALFDGLEIADLARTSQEIVAGDPRLIADCTTKALPAPATADPSEWEKFWRKWPIEHLTKGSGGTPLFEIRGERFVPSFHVASEDQDAFAAMVAEVVDWRLADYLVRASTAGDKTARCMVSHLGGLPVIRLERARNPFLPAGRVSLLVDDKTHEAEFGRSTLSSIALGGSDANVLSDLLRTWFGPTAGHAGTRDFVVLEERADGWSMKPEKSADATVLSQFIGQQFKRQDIPALFDLEFNVGNWNTGHVSLPERNAVVLFVTLTKSDEMMVGGHYVDYFESPSVFVWSSQSSVGPGGKKGREILEAVQDGRKIHLFTRERKRSASGFTYRGVLLPIDHEGEKPMRVRFRLSDT